MILQDLILKKEIETKAEEQGVPKSTIDKDWALGHFVDAIFSAPECRENLVFKGGTCLRKCYFPDYRFSEDLDFTSTSPEFVLNKNLISRITTKVTEQTGMPVHIQELNSLRFNNRLTGFKAVIKFWGADHPRNQTPPPPDRWTTSVKIEIILYELMTFQKQQQKVLHPYSDSLSASPLQIPCYSLQEVLAEKFRSLIQRSYTAPRDFYDIWYLSNHVQEIDWSAVKNAFHEKMKFKEITFTGIDLMINDENDKRLQAAWINSLGHQIPSVHVPDYGKVKRELLILFKKVFGDINYLFQIILQIQIFA